MLQIKRAVDALVPMTKNQTDLLYQINEEIYSKLRYGVQGVKDERGVLTTVYYIDWKDVSNNDFCFAEEVTVLRYDQKTRKRPDLVLYVNGIALGMIELKSSCVSWAGHTSAYYQSGKKRISRIFLALCSFLWRETRQRDCDME